MSVLLDTQQTGIHFFGVMDGYFFINLKIYLLKIVFSKFNPNSIHVFTLALFGYTIGSYDLLTIYYFCSLILLLLNSIQKNNQTRNKTQFYLLLYTKLSNKRRLSSMVTYRVPKISVQIERKVGHH